jgi:hypothetical protein
MTKFDGLGRFDKVKARLCEMRMDAVIDNYPDRKWRSNCVDGGLPSGNLFESGML